MTKNISIFNEFVASQYFNNNTSQSVTGCILLFEQIGMQNET